MNIFVLSLGVAAAIASAQPAAAQQLGSRLPELLAYAKAHHPEIEAARADSAAAAARASAAGNLPDPRLRVEWQDITKGGQQTPTLNPARTGATRYQWMQDLPWPGKRDARRQVAEAEAAGAEATAGASWNLLAARLKMAYAQAFYLRRTAELNQELLALLQQLEAAAQARYAHGGGAQQDVIRVQVEQTMLRNELQALASERAMAHHRINTLLARAVDDPLAEPELAPPDTIGDALTPARLLERIDAANPQLRAERARVNAAEQNLELTRKNRYPDLTLGITPTQTGRSLKNWDLMLELNIPLQQGTRRAEEHAAQSQLRAARARADAARLDLAGELADKLAALRNARALGASIERVLRPQTELNLQSAVASYEAGKVDFATLLDAQRQVREARASALKWELDAQLRQIDIEQLLGEAP